MDKKEEVRQWINEMFTNAQNEDFTGKVGLTLDFSQGGVTNCEITLKGNFWEIKKQI